MRDEFYRDLGDIRIVRYTEIGKEHNVRTHIAHIVTIVFLEAYAIRIPSRMAEIERIYRHKGIEVTRIGDDTDDDLAMVSRSRRATAPEINLILSDRIHLQSRHNSICTYVHGRSTGYIVIEIEVSISIMH